MDVMPEFVRKHSFDFVVGVVLQQRVSEDDAPGVSQSGKRSVGLLALFRELPFVHATHAGAGALAEPYQAIAQLLVLKWNKFVEDGKEHHGSKLGEDHEQYRKSSPGNQPPVAERDTDDGIDEFGKQRHQHQSKQPAFDFVANPGRRALIGEVEAVFEAEAVDIEREAQALADDGKQQHVEEEGENVMFMRHAEGKIA